MDQPGKVANPARSQLNREMDIPLSPYAPEIFFWSRETGSAVASRVSLLFLIIICNTTRYVGTTTIKVYNNNNNNNNNNNTV